MNAYLKLFLDALKPLLAQLEPAVLNEIKLLLDELTKHINSL